MIARHAGRQSDGPPACFQRFLVTTEVRGNDRDPSLRHVVEGIFAALLLLLSKCLLGTTGAEERPGTHIVREWKQGFALIAQAANMPLLPTILDYDTCTVSFRPLITDVRDTAGTLETVRAEAARGVPKAGARGSST